MTKCQECGKEMSQSTTTQIKIVNAKKVQVKNFPVEICTCGFMVYDLFLGAAVETSLEKAGITGGTVDFNSLKVDVDAVKEEFYKGKPGNTENL